MALKHIFRKVCGIAGIYPSRRLRDDFRATVQDGNENRMRYLLDEYPDVLDWKPNNKFFHPLELAVFHGQVKIVEIMLAHDPGAIHLKNQSASLLHEAKFCKNPDMVDTLLRAGADINAKDVFGITPLMAMLNDLLTARLLQYHPDIHARDKSGCTAMMHAARRGCSGQLIDMFIAAGAHINEKDSFGKTALDHSLTDTDDCRGFPAAIALIERGASFDTASSVMKIALRHGNGSNYQPLCKAIEKAVENRKNADLEIARSGLPYDIQIDPPFKLKPKDGLR